MRLFTSERFQKDYKEFTNVLLEIDNEDTKKRLDSLLNELVRYVREIDSRHEELYSLQQPLTSLEDTKQNLISVRRKIDRIVKDWYETKSSR